MHGQQLTADAWDLHGQKRHDQAEGQEKTGQYKFLCRYFLHMFSLRIIKKYHEDNASLRKANTFMVSL
ncbi:hypothetical protein SDC9_203362 [bioreactor metagenome]|uniref:Uncharacterized protein n=1 Tax=bioreactor metagenome TaxID=1076179 RepID=A0A645IW89_9ZZZZ